MRLGPMLAAFLVALLVAARAHAQESTYDRLVDEALAEFDAGHFEEALSAFEQAYKEKPSARALRGVAKALFELRSYARCVTAIDRALASDVDPLPDALRADLASLKERAIRFTGEARIDVVPANATVVLDGATVTPGPIVLDVGAHTLEATAPGHRREERRFEIHGREITSIALRLELVPPEWRPPPPTRDVESRTVPLVLAIGGIVASTGAVVGSSIWLVDRRDAVDRCNGAAAAGAHCSNEGSIAFQQDAATTTLVLSSAALVVSAVALYFVLREPPSKVTTAWAW